MEETRSPKELFSFYLPKSAKSELDIRDFTYIHDDIESMTKMIGHFVRERTPGINILLYGKPGVGKTQLLKALCDHSGIDLVQLNPTKSEGTPLDEEDRLLELRQAQKIVQNVKNMLILFDNADEALARPSRLITKNWLSETLEFNETPTVWIVNSTQDISPQHLRRFSLVYEIKSPSRQTRQKMLKTACNDQELLKTSLISMADYEDLTPAQISIANQLMKMSSIDDPLKSKAEIQKQISNQIRLQTGRDPVLNIKKNVITYKLEYLNTPAELPRLINNIGEIGSCSLLLYGPPGSGKTEFCYHLSRELNIPIIQKRISDIESQFVGETERNLAEMFSTATTSKSILFLDEADSFLRDRTTSEHNWEVTKVNELLVQMEAFTGIFVCSTNLIQELDKASLRRFSAKVHFDYMTLTQSINLFASLLEGKQNTGQLSKKLQTLPRLTPGDYAAAIKQLKLFGQPITVETLYKALFDNSQIKDGFSNPIGFN